MPNRSKRAALLAAFRTSIPVLWGYLAIGMTFGCMVKLQTGLSWWVAMGMSLSMYAGAMQFMAVPLIAGGTDLAQVALMTFLVNARHMVYGLSLFDTFEACGKGKYYAIFALTDEAYALHVGQKPPEGVDQKAYTVGLAALCQSYWVIGSVLGNLLASVLTFDTRGIDFTLTALFLVLLQGQWAQFRTKIPFVAGAGCGLGALVLFGKQHMLIAAVLGLVALLILLRPRLTEALQKQDEGVGA